MNYIIFGGSGFIGTHLIYMIKNECLKSGDNIYDVDIVMPGEEGVVPGVVNKIEGVHYIRFDIRKKIDFSFEPTKDDIIFNLAAVHRTPGHPDTEYFETNIIGAQNVTEFAERYGISKILFTSSIAPYGASENIKDENSLPTPNTPYGISKLVAEKIHQIWQAKELNRELTILRPGIVYGKGEHGNMTRLYKALKGRYFFFTGRKDTIKACIYVKELVNVIKYRVIENSFSGVDVINCSYYPAYNIEQIVQVMLLSANLKRKVFLIPASLLLKLSSLVRLLFGTKVGIHPDRIKKLMVSTNVSGKKLKNSGYVFKYTFEDTFLDWFADCDKKGFF